MDRRTSVDETEHFAFIDALRGWAFLAVLAVHVPTPAGTPMWLSRLKTSGNYGVQLFFVISALTLFMSYESRRTRDRKPVAAFFVRRLFRIAPLFWLGMVFYLWYNGLGPRTSAPSGIHWPQIVSTAFFLHGWHPTSINSVVPGGWSIAVEMNFYLILPLCFVLLTNLRRCIVACGAAFLLSIGISLAAKKCLMTAFPAEQTDLIQTFLYFWFPRQLPVFLLGFILHFLILRSNRVQGTAPDGGRRTNSTLLLPSVAIGLLLLLTMVGHRLPVTYFLFSCGFALLGFALSQRPISLLVNPVTRYVGKVSYSAYITHFCVVGEVGRLVTIQGSGIHLERHPLATFMVGYGICLALTLAASTAAHYLIEIVGQDAGKWLIKHCGWGRRPPSPSNESRIDGSGAGAPPM